MANTKRALKDKNDTKIKKRFTSIIMASLRLRDTDVNLLDLEEREILDKIIRYAKWVIDKRTHQV